MVRVVFPYCAQDFRVNISGSGDNLMKVKEKNPNLKHQDYFEENGTLWWCICNTRNCIRKCCQENEVFSETTCKGFKNSSQNFNRLNLQVSNDYHIVFSDLLCDAGNNFYKVQLEDFDILGNGSVFVTEASATFDLGSYCLETSLSDQGDVVVVFICAPGDENDLAAEARSENIGNYNGSLLKVSNESISILMFSWVQCIFVW